MEAYSSHGFRLNWRTTTGVDWAAQLRSQAGRARIGLPAVGRRRWQTY